MARPFTWRNFAVRWTVALALVFGAFNPTGYSYYHWMAEKFAAPKLDVGPLEVVVGLALLIAYIVYLRATLRSIGRIGVLLVAAFLAALVWLFVDLGLLDPAAVTPMTWVSLLVVATVLAVGISWSHIRRRISGQLDTDDVGSGPDE